LIGVITLRQSHRRPFTERQIQAIEVFADQAVIAISIVGLFDEVQAKTRDLEESLRQQTATADVLKIISRSTFDLDTVLTTLAESATKLSSATMSFILLRDGDMLRLRAHSGHSPDFVEFPFARGFLLDHLGEVVLQHARQFVNFLADLFGELCSLMFLTIESARLPVLV
jgi:hypothetical protein